MYGITLTGKGDYDGALALLTEGLALTEKVGDENFVRAISTHLAGSILSAVTDRAVALNHQAAEGGQKRGDPEMIANAELNLGDIVLQQGDLVLAREYFDKVYRLTHDPTTSDWMKWRYSLHLFASLGDFWLARGDLHRAQESVAQCLQQATRTHARKYLAEELGGSRGKSPWLASNGTRPPAGCNRRWPWPKTLAIRRSSGKPISLGRWYTATQRPEHARQAQNAAHEVIDQVLVGLQEPGLRSSLTRLQQHLLL